MKRHGLKHPFVVALFVLIVGVMLVMPAGEPNARDRGLNQPGSAGNRGGHRR